MTRAERVAHAVDGVVAANGLTVGEAVYALTMMLNITLKGAGPDVREALASAIKESLDGGGAAPLLKVLPRETIDLIRAPSA